ncbi:hydrolase, partial [Burkholderia pseudomallei]|nr:hydrolase [Burkholderia pseudomallei]MBF3727449.1 hydrolase [Burkholderia pseudomallei]MBF3912861.1 hydrolase [Burkholderia pseudomallei]MBF3912867.1 hydrolase [Burkholderia pseudomallei]
NKYQHPRQGFVDAHHAAGWTHPVVPATGAITCVSGDDVRTTNVHSPWSAKPRGVLVGWSKAPHSVPACTLGGGATNCTLPLAKV